MRGFAVYRRRAAAGRTTAGLQTERLHSPVHRESYDLSHQVWQRIADASPRVTAGRAMQAAADDYAARSSTARTVSASPIPDTRPRLVAQRVEGDADAKGERKQAPTDDDEVDDGRLHELNRNEILESLRSNSNAQASVQAKMVEITRLVLEDFTMDEHSRYYRHVVENGLCGGWATLFLRHPDWVEPIYNAVRTWTRPTKLSDSDALLHFEQHLTKKSGLEGAGQVVRLLGEVYDAMSELEPDAGYDQLPDSVVAQKGPPDHDAFSGAVAVDRVIKLRGRNAAKMICAELRMLTETDDFVECRAHIESDIHHMAVRVQGRPRRGKGGRGLMITVVESEIGGIRRVETWTKAEYALNQWLAFEEPDLAEVSLRASCLRV